MPLTTQRDKYPVLGLPTYYCEARRGYFLFSNGEHIQFCGDIDVVIRGRMGELELIDFLEWKLTEKLVALSFSHG